MALAECDARDAQAACDEAAFEAGFSAFEACQALDAELYDAGEVPTSPAPECLGGLDPRSFLGDTWSEDEESPQPAD
eukprot:2752085-Alexandrium_andersonii.AAC.1